MADQFQYIKLPDGSYGKFAGDATDDVIRSAVIKDFPDAFSGGSRTLTPPSIMNKRTPPGSEHMQGQDPFDFGNTPTTPITPMSIAAGTAKDAYTMTRAGYQNAAKGIATGLLHRKSAPLGEPPSQDEFLDAAKNIGTGMVMGGIEGEGMAPAASRLTRTADSAPPPTSEAFAPRVPPVRGRSSPVSAGGGGAEFASDVMNVIKPKGLKVLELGRKWGNRWFGKGEAAADAGPAAVTEPPMPHDRAGKGIYGTPVDMWGKTEPTPAPRSPVSRPEPAWKRLTKGESNSGGAGPETGGESVVQSPFDAPQYRNASKVLTRGNQGGANYSADDLIAFKKKHGVTDIPAETPSHQPGETATSTAAEVRRLDKDGGQLGQPPATAKLQKFPMTGVKAVGEINPHPRKYYPDNPDAVTDEDVNVAARLKKKGSPSPPQPRNLGAAAADDESNPLLKKVQRAERSGEVGGGENIEKLKWRLMKSMKVIGDSDISVGVEPYNKFVKATGFDHLQDEGAWFHRHADDAQFEKFTQLVNGIKDPSDVSMAVKQLRQIRGATTRLRKK